MSEHGNPAARSIPPDQMAARLLALENMVAALVALLDRNDALQIADDLITVADSERRHASGKHALYCFALEDMVERINAMRG